MFSALEIQSIRKKKKHAHNYWNSNQNICKGFDSGPKDLKNIDFQRKAFDMYRICRQNIQKVSDLRKTFKKY